MKKLIAAGLLITYIVIWVLQENKSQWTDFYLSPAPPAPLLQAATGYARQMAGFSLFVKVAVFAGGPLRNVDKMSYAENLAQNFEVMTALYPEFHDPYHYCQSLLAPTSPEFARRANVVLDRAVAFHPDVMYFPFFQAFNHFYYLQEPIKAAELFFALSKYPDAPPWFGHLAGTLMGRGGDLLAGRTMLKAMLAVEEDGFMKERYLRSIRNFDEAIAVQNALDLYRREHGVDAYSLEDLLPHYLAIPPNLDEEFKLVWEPPQLRLERP